MMDKINEYYYKAEAFFHANPVYVWLVVAVIFIPLGIGAILGKSWAVDPANGKQRFWYGVLGHKVFGRVVGAVFLLGGLAALAMFFWQK